MKKQDHQKRRRRVRRYDEEFKANALELVKDGRSVPSVAEALGIDKSLLYSWRRQAEGDSEPSASQMTENERLRRRVMELEQERDILKKALAIFSRKTGD